MKNILFSDSRLPKQMQLRRMQHVMDNELTELQRQLLLAVYYEGKSQKQIAQERGVCCSTVCRTLQRAVRRMQRYLRY